VSAQKKTRQRKTVGEQRQRCSWASLGGWEGLKEKSMFELRSKRSQGRSHIQFMAEKPNSYHSMFSE
jgi:hypothetical protein